MAPDVPAHTVSDVRERLLKRLKGVKAHGDYFMALCPSHADSKPSLSIREHEDGCSVKCHTGCETEEILGAIGLTKSDLYPKKPEATLEVSKSSTSSEHYYYEDIMGRPLFRVWRTPNKSFIQQRYEGGRYLDRLGDVEPVLYHLPELVARPDEPVFVVEGEKDADRLLDLGLLATTSPMGAGKWKEEYATFLADRGTIYVIPDNDSPGEKHAKDVADTLPQAKIVRLPAIPIKGDVSDWLDAGGTSAGLLKLAEQPNENGHKKSRLLLRRGGDLLAKEFPPVKWVVPGLIPAGTMLFGGAPKMGKSWACLGLCISVATGGLALGAIPVEQGDTCYLALEDVERRLQDRSQQIMKSDLAGSGDINRFQYTETSGRIDQGLLEDIEEEFLKVVPDPRLVVVDTLAAVKPPSTKSRNVYDEDYGAVKELTAMAGDYRTGVILVTHLNQGDHKDHMNKITGSTGLTGGVDGSLVLDRVRGEADAVLRAWHRDLKEDPELALERVDGDKGFWRYMGDAEEYRMGKERRQIYTVLARNDEEMRPIDVATEIDKDPKTVARTMQRMRDDGYLVSRSYGKYIVSPYMDGPPSLSPPRSCRTDVVKPNSESEVRQYDNYNDIQGEMEF